MSDPVPSLLADITVSIRAEVRLGAGRTIHIGRQVTASSDEKREDVRNTVTLAIRQVNEEIKDSIR